MTEDNYFVVVVLITAAPVFLSGHLPCLLRMFIDFAILRDFNKCIIIISDVHVHRSMEGIFWIISEENSLILLTLISNSQISIFIPG